MKFSFSLIILSLIIIVSCKRSGELFGPNISVSPVSIEAWKSDTIQFNYSVKSHSKLVELTITPDANILSPKKITSFNDACSSTGYIEYTIPQSGINNGNTIEIIFRVFDEDGEEYAAETAVKIILVEQT